VLYKNKTRSYLSNDDFQVRKSKGKHALSNSSSGGSGSYLHPSIESSDSEAEANDDDETDGGKRTTKRRRVSAWDSDTIDFVDYDYE
jgi:hypothetical protein